MPVEQMTIAERWTRLQERVAAAAGRVGRSSDAVRIVAVTKRVGSERIVEALEAGVRHLGENRVQEALRHMQGVSALTDIRPSWHMIGHLQRNKAKDVVRRFDRLDSLDSLRLARTLQKRLEREDERMPVLLEVNVSGEESKYGFTPDSVVEAARAVSDLDRLEVRGLMAIGPLTDDRTRIRRAFQQLVGLRDTLASTEAGGTWETLSMGMSDDFEIAIEEGATEIRVGRVLFGSREKGGLS